MRGKGAQHIDEVIGAESGEEMDETLDEGDRNDDGNRGEENDDHYSMMIGRWFCRSLSNCIIFT